MGKTLAILALLVPAFASASADLRPQLRKTERYGETFTFVSDLDDGSYVQLQLAVTNLGPGSANGLCRILVVRPGRAPWHVDERFDRDEWSWTGGGEEKLQMGPCSATASPTATKVVAALEGGKVELTLPPLAPLVPPGARIAAGSASYQTRILLPSGKAEVTLQLPGEIAPRTVAGGAYADQSRSDVAPTDLARSWVRFRSLRGDTRLLVLGRQAPDGSVGPLWSLVDQTFRSLHTYVLERAGAKKSPGWNITLDDGTSGKIRSEALLYRHAPVEDLGLVGRAVAPLVGSPVTFTYRAVLERAGLPDLTGILEVSLSEE